MSNPKQNRLKARLPRGLADRGPAEIAATREMLETIRNVYELYGFEPVETPAIEYTDALGKFLPDQDRPNEGVFSFQDDDEQWLSLRYDLTAPLARYVAENYDALPKPYRSYRAGYVYRNEKPGPGRYRQFMQFDADTVGSSSPAADAEICMMAADTMEALGIPRGSYVIKVNNRLLLDQVLDGFGFSDEEDANKRLTVLRAVDKLDRLGIEGVRQLLGAGRKDESGDFTKGAALTSDQITFFEQSYFGFISEGRWMAPDTFDALRPMADMQIAEDGKLFDNLAMARGLLDSFPIDSHGYNGAGRLGAIVSICESAGYGSRRIRIDPSVVRGLEYYTGPVFEAELTFEIKDEKGRPVRFGSVGGGGRYDGLVGRFRPEQIPATGFSIGVSRLQAALTALGKPGAKSEYGPVVVTVFDRDRVADYQRMVSSLRNAGIRSELYLGNPKNIGNQLKYADKRNAPCVIIQGGDEKNDPAGPQVIVKDLALGAELAKLEKGRDEYLQKQADAQRKVPEEKLVDAVRAVLARHK
jgi:histidyl-tRNA synthetase